MQSALTAIESDPKQAARALRAQARGLAEVSAGKEPLKRLEAVALSFEAYLLGPAVSQGLSRGQIEAFAGQLIAAAPAEATQQAA